MTSTNTVRQPCSKCGFTGWVFPCDGCHASFCIKHAPDHRAELAAQLNKIQEQHDHLQHIYNQHEKYQDHPLFSQIDVWENDTITKIQQTAQIARDELRQLLDESNNRIKTIFNQFNDQLQIGRQNEHYTEIELNQWNEQLINIKKQLETPCDIELIPDKNSPPIHLIKVNTTKQNIIIQIPLFSQPIQLYEDTNNDECSSNNEIDKPQSSIIDINTEDTCVLESKESSVVPKEEPERNLNLCNTEQIEHGLLLDLTKNMHLILLQLSPTILSQLPPILSQLTNHKLQIFTQKDDCLNELKRSEQSIVFIDIPDIPSNEQNSLLDNISELDNVYSIYIRGIPSEENDERDHFFRRYSKIRAMFENDQRLIVQWAIDTANECKKTGDFYVENGDKDKGRKCFEEGIILYKRLSTFLNEKRHIR